MKRVISLLLCLAAAASLTGCVGCKGAAVSNREYREIAAYVEENGADLVPAADTAFFEFETSGLGIGGVYYGYYYSERSELLVPDFYSGGDLGGECLQKDGGTYFGLPRNGNDWCFVRQIQDRWFYYELHWA